jgi:hypothetical protein
MSESEVQPNRKAEDEDDMPMHRAENARACLVARAYLAALMSINWVRWWTDCHEEVRVSDLGRDLHPPHTRESGDTTH